MDQSTAETHETKHCEPVNMPPAAVDEKDANAVSPKKIKKGCKKYGPISLILTILIGFIAYHYLSSPTPPTPTAPGKSLQLDCKPTIQELLKLRCGSEELRIISDVAEDADDCYNFGLFLGLALDIVNKWWDSPGHSREYDCEKIVEQWLIGKGQKGDGDSTVTWKTILGALQNIKHNELVRLLEECIT